MNSVLSGAGKKALVVGQDVCVISDQHKNRQTRETGIESIDKRSINPHQ